MSKQTTFYARYGNTTITVQAASWDQAFSKAATLLGAGDGRHELRVGRSRNDLN